MEQNYNREQVIARLIANTKRKVRHDNLIEIANQIRWLEKDLGSLNTVSKAIGISTDQLRQFLSVEKMSPEVMKLVKERKIDRINTIHYMKNFDYDAQNKIADEVLKGHLTPGDIRVMAPLRQTSDNNIMNLISRVQKTKNVKVYVLYFRVPKVLRDSDILLDNFVNIIGQNEISSFKVEGSIAMLEVTEAGKRNLREQANRRNQTLKDYINTIIRELARLY